PARSTTRSLKFKEMVTSACSSRNLGTRGATWRRPKPAGAVMRKWPLAFTPPALTLASALPRSASRRWQSSRKALPSWVSVMRRVVRTSSFTPRRSSSASRRRPMIAGATPSALAAAVRLPLEATETKDSSCLSLSIERRLCARKSAIRLSQAVLGRFTLLELHAGLADRIAPARVFRLQELGKVLRRPAQGNAALGQQLGQGIGLAERLLGRRIQALAHIAGCARRCNQRLPVGRFEPLVAAFVDGGDVRQHRNPLGRSDRQGPQLAALTSGIAVCGVAKKMFTWPPIK